MREILQYLHNGRPNVELESELDLAAVPSSMKWRKLIAELRNRLDALN